MSERPTPRTDSAIMEIPSKFDSICVVRVELALDLERELGEALDDLQVLRSNKMSDPLLETTFKHLIRERDEARELVYAWESRWKAEVEFAAKVSVKRDELLDILRKLLEIIPEPECHDFGHTKEERHAFLEECPVMARYDALIAQAKEAAK